MDQPFASFTAWLYRPYIDLGAAGCGGNPFTSGVALALQSVLDGQDEGRRVHGFHTPGFRDDLLKRSHLPEYRVDDPSRLASDHRTPGWQVLCDQLADFESLDARQQVRILWLLHRMCLPKAVLRYAARARDTTAVGNECSADIELLVGLTIAALSLDQVVTLDLTPLHDAWAHGTPGEWARIEASYLAAQLNIKVENDLVAAHEWIERHFNEINAANLTDHDYAKFMSRYHRIAAMLPQIAGDLDGMTRDMNEAEHWSGLMRRDSPERKAEWEALTAAMLQSRTKEALVLGDFERAEQYGRLNVAHAPTTPQFWADLGQVLLEREDVAGAAHAYAQAARYGPPLTEVALFMSGQCWEELGEDHTAIDCYLGALAIDPLGISAVERLQSVATRVADTSLGRWSTAYLEHLRQAPASEAEVRKLLPYQEYAGVLGG